MKKMKYCTECSQKVSLEIPDGDNRQRYVCHNCPKVYYHNPVIICATIIEYEQQILLCKRNIQPRFGLWTIPGGFMEVGESTKAGAIRETYEESLASLQDIELFGVYDLIHAEQIYIVYKAKLQKQEFGSTPESQEVKLFNQNCIPWQEIAFKVVKIALQDFFENKNTIHRKIVEK